MNIRSIRGYEVEAARQLLAACGWTKKVADPLAFAKSVESSQVALVAEEQGRIVGFLRAITDGVFNGYISMVAVAEGHRRSGIGAALMREAMGTNSNITWVLRADRPGVPGFYKSLGFQESSAAMEKRRADA